MHMFSFSFLDPTLLSLLFTRIFSQWVVQSNELPQQHLSGTIVRLKAFNAKRKWRAVATVVMMGARLSRKKRDRQSSEEKALQHLQHGCEQALAMEIRLPNVNNSGTGRRIFSPSLPCDCCRRRVRFFFSASRRRAQVIDSSCPITAGAAS